ncbi:MAG: kinase domain protein [Myxococcaceae bacterium]|nr:kinase domain protein [Myxococcaceae bacterium]
MSDVLDLPLLLRCAFIAAIAVAATACSAADDPAAFDDEVAADASTDGASPEDDARVGVDAGENDAHTEAGNGCPEGMARLDTFCVDRYEAQVVDVDDAGIERPHSPYDVIVGRVRAKAAAGVVPQGYISQVQAAAACAESNKRLCTAVEFASACRGSADAGSYYPYGGKTKIVGACNEGKGSFVPKLFGPDAQAWTYDDFNDPRLNQIDGGLARTGAYASCVSPAGVHDCVGNLHEWGADPADAKGHGRFRGGFYGDAELNGPGCLYVTSAHELTYHDYSTGFRCCADAAP